jgi:cytochrome c5
MNEQNEEFEAFLRQFHLRKLAPLPGVTSPGRRWRVGRANRWLLVTAAATTAVLLLAALVWKFEWAAGAQATMKVTGNVPIQLNSSNAPAEPRQRSAAKPVKPNPSVIAQVHRPATASVGQNGGGGPQQPAGEPEQQQQSVAPDNSGKEIFDRACSACHTLDIANSLHFATRAEYEAYVSGKISKGARISTTEFPVLVDYLFKTYSKN